MFTSYSIDVDMKNIGIIFYPNQLFFRFRNSVGFSPKNSL